MAYDYVHNMDEAEDILQETLIKILEVNLDSDDEEYIKAYYLCRKGSRQGCND